MTALEDLRRRLFEDLAIQVRTRHPEVQKDFQADIPHDEAEMREWGRRLSFPPLEPWNSSINGVLAVELQLGLLSFASESALQARDGLAFYFFQSHQLLVASTCFEAMEYVLKKMSRAKRPLLPRNEGNRLLADLVAKREDPQFGDLRHAAAHGPQTGLGKGGWLEAASERRAWELMALADLDASDVVPSFISGNSLSAVSENVIGSIRLLSDRVAQIVEESAAQAIEAMSYQPE